MNVENAAMRKALGDLIRKQRLSIHLTQEDLAARAGISFEHLNRVENYRAMASVEVIDRIARALGFERPSAFLERDGTRTL